MILKSEIIDIKASCMYVRLEWPSLWLWNYVRRKWLLAKGVNNVRARARASEKKNVYSRALTGLTWIQMAFSPATLHIITQYYNGKHSPHDNLWWQLRKHKLMCLRMAFKILKKWVHSLQSYEWCVRKCELLSIRFNIAFIRVSFSLN